MRIERDERLDAPPDTREREAVVRHPPVVEDERVDQPQPDDTSQERIYGDERSKRDPSAIRAEDTEPYVALQYVARLFKIVAMVVVVALTAEIVAGVALEGASAILPLMAEVVQGVVLAALLWGAGDLTLLLIDVGHDVRAARVLLGRLSARSVDEEPVFHPERED